jgi:hypothetical protein
MKLLLTSDGISNTSIHNALVELPSKPIAESSALCIPTAVYPFCKTYASDRVSGRRCPVTIKQRVERALVLIDDEDSGHGGYVLSSCWYACPRGPLVAQVRCAASRCGSACRAHHTGCHPVCLLNAGRESLGLARASQGLLTLRTAPAPPGDRGLVRFGASSQLQPGVPDSTDSSVLSKSFRLAALLSAELSPLACTLRAC